MFFLALSLSFVFSSITYYQSPLIYSSLRVVFLFITILSRFQKKNKDQKSFCRTRRKKEWEELFPRRFFSFFFFSFVVEYDDFRSRTRPDFLFFAEQGAYTFTSRRNDICVLMRAFASYFLLLFSSLCRHLALLQGIRLLWRKRR